MVGNLLYLDTKDLKQGIAKKCDTKIVSQVIRVFMFKPLIYMVINQVSCFSSPGHQSKQQIRIKSGQIIICSLRLPSPYRLADESSDY